MQALGSGRREVELMVNGKKHQAIIRSADTLLRVLREHLGLTGAAHAPCWSTACRSSPASCSPLKLPAAMSQRLKA